MMFSSDSSMPGKTGKDSGECPPDETASGRGEYSDSLQSLGEDLEAQESEEIQSRRDALRGVSVPKKM